LELKSGEIKDLLASGQSFWMVSTDMAADVFPAEIEMVDNSKVSTIINVCKLLIS